MIKHHNYFKVHLPKKQYKGDSEDELAEIVMEEAYLAYDGKCTKDYKPNNPKIDKFEISLYPSILYATNKLNYSENEKFKTINDFLDNQFVDFLEKFYPQYKCTNFIEYHLAFFKGNKLEFYKHIKYQILNIIRKRKDSKKKNFDYNNLEIIINDWVNEKMISNEHKSNSLKAENIIINNKSKFKTQSIKSGADKKESKWTTANLIITIIASIVTIIGIIWEIMN